MSDQPHTSGTTWQEVMDATFEATAVLRKVMEGKSADLPDAVNQIKAAETVLERAPALLGALK